MNDAVVVGAGGHAKVVISTLRAAGMRAAVVVDDDLSKKGQQILGVPVIGDLKSVDGAGFEVGVIAIGNNSYREKAAARLALNWITVVHPYAHIHESVKLGLGTVVFAGAIIQADTIIGNHVIVNTGATIDHDCRIGDFAHMAPGVHLAGNVTVGRASLVGIGSVAIPGIRIGERTTIGAGSVIVRDVPDNVIACGNPARMQCRSQN